MVSLIITCSGLLFGLGAIPFGRLSDRYGPVAVNMVGIGISWPRAPACTSPHRPRHGCLAPCPRCGGKHLPSFRLHPHLMLI
jgi:MFS family permease